MFHGHAKSVASKLIYSESAKLFADIIKNNFKPGSYTLIDLGGHKGEFLSDLLNFLPGYNFESTIIDMENDIYTSLKSKKIISDIINSGLSDKSADIIILRYVLAWNSLEKQKEILKEVSRICKGICMIQHQGSKNNDSLLFQSEFGEIIPKMKGSEGVFTDPNTVEKCMSDLGVHFYKLQERRVDGLSDIAIEKYSLARPEAQKIKELLKGRDYVIQTTWVLEFK